MFSIIWKSNPNYDEWKTERNGIKSKLWTVFLYLHTRFCNFFLSGQQFFTFNLLPASTIQIASTAFWFEPLNRSSSNLSMILIATTTPTQTETRLKRLRFLLCFNFLFHFLSLFFGKFIHWHQRLNIQLKGWWNKTLKLSKHIFGVFYWNLMS